MVLWGRKQGDKERYTQMMYFEHRWFDVKGLSTQAQHMLELDRVYVKLRIAPEKYQDVHHEMFFARQSDGSYIWEYLKSYKRALVILGAPGSGKTTLLRSVVLNLLNKKLRNETGLPRKTVPIFLYLRDLATPISRNINSDLVTIVNNNLEQIRLKLEKGTKTPQERPNDSWIEQQIRKKRCVIVLDGLDEIADAVTRRRVVTWVQRQFELHAGNKFVVTSRPGGYIANPLKSITSFEVKPFDYIQQEEFIHNWYRAQEFSATGSADDGVKANAYAGAEDLLERIRGSADLSGLATNPLTLTMIAHVHRFKNQLPGKRVELYAEICKVFLGQWHASKGIMAGKLTFDQNIHVLQPLAFHMMAQKKREIEMDEIKDIIGQTLREVDQTLDPANFVQIIQDNSGLLIEKELKLYSFSHKTFQEYLAASYISNTPKLLRAIASYVDDVWWHETIRLYTAQNDATIIIKACIKAIDPHDMSKSTAPLELGIKCLEERMRVDPDVEAEFHRMVQSGVDGADEQMAAYFREGLLNMRLNKMLPLTDNSAVDQSLMTQAEYQLFIDQRGRNHVERQPDHWTLPHFLKGQGNDPIVGMRAYDAGQFCAWLTQYWGNVWEYRLPRAGEIDPDYDFGHPFWMLDHEGQVVSSDRNRAPRDFRVDFEDALMVFEALVKDKGSGNKLREITPVAMDLIHALDTEHEEGVELRLNIDDRFLDLAYDLAQPNRNDLRLINETIDDYEVPKEFWRPGTAPENTPRDTQEVEQIAILRRTIARLERDNGERLNRGTAQKPGTDGLYDIENLCSLSEQYAVYIAKGLPERTERGQVYNYVISLSLTLRRARNLAYRTANQEQVSTLRYAHQIADVDPIQLTKIDVMRMIDVSLLLANLRYAPDVSDRVLGLIHEVAIRNAMLWNLISFIHLRPEVVLPRKIFLRRYIAMLCSLMIIELQSEMLDATRRHLSRMRIFTKSSTLAGLQEKTDVALKKLTRVLDAIQEIEDRLGNEQSLEGILLVKQLKQQSAENGHKGSKA